jgi:hypothetical protein
VRGKHREFYNGDDEFLAAVRRRKTPETQGDMLDIDIMSTP